MVKKAKKQRRQGTHPDTSQVSKIGSYKDGYMDKAVDVFHGGKSPMEQIRDQLK